VLDAAESSLYLLMSVHHFEVNPNRTLACSISHEITAQVIADTTGAYRVLETSHPPTYYIPPKDVDMQQLKPSSGSSYCEWKGSASYYDAPGKPKIAWYYAKPSSSFKPIANYICFYPSKIDKATVGDETVKAQPGDHSALLLAWERSLHEQAFLSHFMSRLSFRSAENLFGMLVNPALSVLSLNKVHARIFVSASQQWYDNVLLMSGDFYGGWITSKLVGPFKGSPGTMGW